MVAVLGDLGRLVYCNHVSFAAEDCEDLIFLVIEFNRENMGIGRHVETITDGKSSAAKDRWRPASFLKGTDGDDARFDFGDGIGKCRQLTAESMCSCQE